MQSLALVKYFMRCSQVPEGRRGSAFGATVEEIWCEQMCIIALLKHTRSLTRCVCWMYSHAPTANRDMLLDNVPRYTIGRGCPEMHHVGAQGPTRGGADGPGPQQQQGAARHAQPLRYPVMPNGDAQGPTRGGADGPGPRQRQGAARPARAAAPPAPRGGQGRAAARDPRGRRAPPGRGQPAVRERRVRASPLGFYLRG